MNSIATQTILIPLRNQTGLKAQDFTIYVLGFSPTSKKMLNVAAGTKTAKFVTMPNATGTLPVYKLGIDIDQISVDVTPPNPPTQPFANKIDGARIYFFVANNAVFPTAPVVKYSGGGSSVINVKNPPNSDVPPYTFAEFTIVDLQYGAVIDLQTVDGLTFPVNLTLNDSLGAVGQPPAGVHRNGIFDAYKPYMKSLGSEADPFLDLQYSENSGGLLNPGIYLTETNATNEQTNLKNPLNTYFDAELKSLFANRNLSIQGVAMGNIAADVYTVAAIGEQRLPTKNGLTHLAMQFKGRKTGIDLKIFSPLGLCTLTFEKNGVQTAISGQLNDTTLTFDTALPAETNIVVGMYASGAGVDPTSTTVKSVTRDSKKQITGVVINGTETGKPAPSQYGFSKIPSLFMTSGAMVFANAGVFAYSEGYTADQSAVVLNLQNQIVSALNRGIANAAPMAGVDGRTSEYWGTQAHWYPKGTTQNLFSLFMHTATVTVGKDQIPIFIQAKNSVKCARGTIMGQAYGFAYDENAGPVPPAPPGQPEVPAKYDPLPKGANVLAITLGAWS
ncbi:MAG: beta-1,3-glucanase family protein [Planctomycetota bacterium]